MKCNINKNTWKDIVRFKNNTTGDYSEAAYENKPTAFILNKTAEAQQCILQHVIPDVFDLKANVGDKIVVEWDTVKGNRTYRTVLGAFTVKEVA